MFHVAAYEESIDNTENFDLDAVPDDILQRQNDHFIFAQPHELFALWAGSATLSRGRVTTPTLRQYTTPYMLPIEGAALPADTPNVVDLRERPLIIPQNEEFAVELTSAIACGNEQSSAICFFRRSKVPAPGGEVYMWRGTSVTAAVARKWTEITMTWQDTPRHGNYAVVGGVIVSTNAIAFRTVFEDQVYRPGGLGKAAESTTPWIPQLYGGLGMWGVFRAERPPLVQVYCNGTDADHTVYLALQRHS